ncbi:MAG TPA: hypothetical protein ENN73_02585, partial [Firmicutes bacterium]|nr:hypothetical protein [Bacillota bacterium]
MIYFPVIFLQQNPMELLRDIRPQEDLNYNFLNLILFIIGCAILFTVLVYFFLKIFSYRRNLKKEEPAVILEKSLEEILPDYLRALSSVNRRLEPVKVYILLNFIFRLMLEKKFKFNALEFTTSE